MPFQRPLNATLIQRIDVTPDTTRFLIHLDDPFHPLTFIPGQWTELGLPRSESGHGEGIRLGWDEGPTGSEVAFDGIIRRAYSIASAPGRDLEFFYNLVEEGGLTPTLWKVQEGDRLFVEPVARGHFTLLGIDPEQPLVFAGAGTGIAPFVSFLTSLESNPLPNPVVLLHGARTSGHLGYEELFRNLDKERNNFRYHPSLTRDENNTAWTGLRGRLPEFFRDLDDLSELAGFEVNARTSRVFLCGPASMIREVENELMKHRFTPRWEDSDGNIHAEIYY